MHSPRMERTLFRVIKEFFFKNSPVDWNGRYETPAGKARHGRPHRRLRRGGSRTARGKRVPVVDQRFFLQTLKKDVSASFLQSVEGFIKQ
jgi:hypothetical protein